MTVSDVSKVGDLLWPWYEALGEVKLGDDGAPIVFAKALSDVSPTIFAKALQKASKFIFNLFHEDLEISVSAARFISKRFAGAARREYKRLQMASGAPNTGPA